MTPDGRGPSQPAHRGSVAALLGLLAVTGCSQGGTPPYEALAGVAQAEDRRAAEIEPALLQALEHPDPAVRTAGYRALGRHERPQWIDVISRGLQDPDPTVRGTAVIATGQAAFSSGAAEARTVLSAAVGDERHPLVRGILAETMGRLARGDDPAGALAVEGALVEIGSDPGDAAPLSENPVMIARPVELLVRGFGHLARGTSGAYPRTPASLDLLAQLARYGRNGPGQPGLWADSGADLASARVRRTAFAALTAVRSVPTDVLDDALADPDAGVRVAGTRALAALAEVDRRAERAARALDDAYFLVRLLSLDVHDRWLRDAQGCSALLRGAADENAHVASHALDLLGAAPCPPVDADAQLRVLAELARALDDGRDWQRATHAWLSLARLGRAQARAELPRYAGHASPFVRAYAARGAGMLGEERVLRRLTTDADANVRAAALSALGALVGHGADDVYAEALASEDPALVMTAAGLLEGTPDRARAVPRLWAALDRFAERGRETERDARIALLARLAELAASADSVRLRPHTASFDVRLAQEAAGVMSRWTGRAIRATPADPPSAPDLRPTAEALARLDGSYVVLEMERGGAIRIRLAPLLAPTNAIRFARLAESGELDGRTFHRVVPGFVIQGGSPNANEYSGYGAYTRDEVGLGAHWRGTVGLSTRGRDTGDGQMFVNLVDNLRLDHNYTIFGQVVEGMDVVDAVLEGDVVRRASLELAGNR